MERVNLNPSPSAHPNANANANPNPNPNPNLRDDGNLQAGPPAAARPGRATHPLARRAWQRIATRHPVVLVGPEGRYVAQAVDLSRGGVLLAVEDPDLVGEDDAVEGRVAEHFPEGLEIRFVETDITRRARIARIVLSPGRTLGLGCSFDRALSMQEALVLGVVAGETHVPEVRLQNLPFEPLPGSPLTLVLEDQVAGLAGPFALGPVLGTGEYSVDANLPQELEAIVACCGDGPFHAALVVGSERLWEAPATLVICEAVEHVGTRVRVLFEDSFDHRMARRLRRRAL